MTFAVVVVVDATVVVVEGTAVVVVVVVPTDVGGGDVVVAGAEVLVRTAVVVNATVMVDATVAAGVAVSELPPHPETTSKNVTATAYFLMAPVCHPTPQGGRRRNRSPQVWIRAAILRIGQLSRYLVSSPSIHSLRRQRRCTRREPLPVRTCHGWKNSQDASAELDRLYQRS